MNRSLHQPNDPPAAKGSPAASRSGLARIWLLALLLLASACLIAALFGQLFNPPPASTFLQIGLLSKKVADYSADPRSLAFPPKEASFIQDILQDKDPYATDLPVRLATLDSVLEEPIPTATPLPQGLPPETATARAIARATHRTPPGKPATHTPRGTPGASSTPAHSPTASRKLTGTPTPTPTLRRSATITATPTCVPTNSSTHSCTPTPSKEPGASPSSTAKVSPTRTRTPNPAITVPVKPTATRTPNCSPTGTTPCTPTPTNTRLPTGPSSTPTATAAPVVIPTLTTCNSIPANSLAAVADSYVDQSRADKNFGSDASLYIAPSAGVDKRALIRFDLRSIPSGSQVLAAILYVNNGKGNNYAVSVLQVTTPWDEMSVTWNNQPTANPATAVGTIQMTTDKCNHGTFINRTLVQSWVDNPGANYGIMLYPPGGTGDVKFSSREGSQAPQLFVVYQ